MKARSSGDRFFQGSTLNTKGPKIDFCHQRKKAKNGRMTFFRSQGLCRLNEVSFSDEGAYLGFFEGF